VRRGSLLRNLIAPRRNARYRNVVQNGQDRRPNKIGPKELAHELGVSERTIDNWRKRKWGPPYYREVNRIYYYREDIEAWRQNAKWG
jgi:hypothetical protein